MDIGASANLEVVDKFCYLGVGMYRIVNFTIRPEPDSECGIRPEPKPDSKKVASQAQ